MNEKLKEFVVKFRQKEIDDLNAMYEAADAPKMADDYQLNNDDKQFAQAVYDFAEAKTEKRVLEELKGELILESHSVKVIDQRLAKLKGEIPKREARDE